MYWTLELASKLEDAPWPATKDELIDYAMRSGAPLEVIENLQEMEDEGEIYESIEGIQFTHSMMSLIHLLPYCLIISLFKSIAYVKDSLHFTDHIFCTHIILGRHLFFYLV